MRTRARKGTSWARTRPHRALGAGVRQSESRRRRAVCNRAENPRQPPSSQAPTNNVQLHASTVAVHQLGPGNQRQPVVHTSAFCRLRRMPDNAKRPPNFLAWQANDTPRERAATVDWLVRVGGEVGLGSFSTLSLCVCYIDRFLTEVRVPSDELRLVGVAALVLASEHQGVGPPDETRLSLATGNRFSYSQVDSKADEIAQTLNLQLLPSTVCTFLDMFRLSLRVDDEVLQLSNFLGELTLLEVDVLQRFEPSLIACATVSLALLSCNCPSWGDDLGQMTGYCLSDLAECRARLLRLFKDASDTNGASTLRAIPNKYAEPNPYLCVSRIPPPTNCPESG